MKLMTVEAARAAMLAHCAPVGLETVPLNEALGRFLAEDVVASRDQPPFAAAAMDGWAVRSCDGAGPRRIIGESAAGRGFDGEVRAGETVRIFTGAAIPNGADAVVIQEDTRREGNTVTIPGLTEPRHIRPAGLDFRAGDILLTRGSRLDPWTLSLAAAAGWATVKVARRPVVAILSTGEEVVEPSETPGPFQIYNSGSTALSGLVALWGGVALMQRPVGDDLAAIVAAVKDLTFDILVTIGGASVGDHDLVKPALETLGLTLAVESVALRPGKPTSFGVLGDGRRVLGLPGNPGSAMACAELFLRPALRTMLGADPALKLQTARAAMPLAANGPREHWMRTRLIVLDDGILTATPLLDQDSSLVTVFAEADGLLRRSADSAAVLAGERVDVLRLDRLS